MMLCIGDDIEAKYWYMQVNARRLEKDLVEDGFRFHYAGE